MVQLGQDGPICTGCRTTLVPGASFCTACGQPTAGDTLQVESGRVRRQDGQPSSSVAGRSLPPGVTAPTLFLGFLFVLAVLVVAAVLGQWLISLLLVPVLLTLGVALAMMAWGDIEAPVDRMVEQTTESLWSAARVVRVSVASWTRAGRAEASLRARRRRLRARQQRLLRTLGEAVYVGDQARIDAARHDALVNGTEIERCTSALRAARTGATERVQAEREATAPTEAFTAVPSAGHDGAAAAASGGPAAQEHAPTRL